jgi:hypothetical protein
MLPQFAGLPIRVELRATLGPYHAATSIPKRLILLERALLTNTGEFDRILIHEIFHFVWVRLSNSVRQDWEQLLASESAAGELGWSAELRKSKLNAFDAERRSPRWRQYARESFCDSAAWFFSELKTHDEFTLPVRCRRARKQWLERNVASQQIAI